MSPNFLRMAIRACLAPLALALVISTTLAADETAQPFNGKDLTGWKSRGDISRSKWVVGKPEWKADAPNTLHVSPGGDALINSANHSVDLYTLAKFGDVHLEIDVMVPKGSNSGIYLMGNYEIQVLDSYGHTTLGPGEMGGIYSTAGPKVIASKAPGEWQKFEIDFRAPKFDANGKKTANARVVRATLNGKLIHEDVEIKGVTGGAMSAEAATGPLMLQGDHGVVAYRNISIKPLTSDK